MKSYGQIAVLLLTISSIAFSGCAVLRPPSKLAASDARVACDGGCDSICDGACDSYVGSSRQVVRGRRYPFLDRTGSVFGVVNKLALWDRRADNHDISPQTESAVVSYLDHNGLNSVLVRVNQYDPVGEWRRMVANDRIAAPWRYTFGTYDWLKYALIPGRLLGGDWYNPFSDTIHLYSDIPSIGLAKAAYAKDVHSRDYPGLYAAGQDAPIAGLWHETLATQEVTDYLAQKGTVAEQQEAERILYPDFGGAVGAQVLGFLPYGSVYGRAAGAVTGHAFRGVKRAVSGSGS